MSGSGLSTGTRCLSANALDVIIHQCDRRMFWMSIQEVIPLVSLCTRMVCSFVYLCISEAALSNCFPSIYYARNHTFVHHLECCSTALCFTCLLACFYLGIFPVLMRFV